MQKIIYVKNILMMVFLMNTACVSVDDFDFSFKPSKAYPSVASYVQVNELKMYYEVYGQGKPLVLLHGGGSTIDTTYGRIIPYLARNYKVIAIEEQGHGRTADIDRPLSFEQSADDVAAVLKHLKVRRADFFGFSNGGNIAMQVAIRHPQMVRKLILGSVIFKRDGLKPEIWEMMRNASVENMPQELKEAYIAVSPDPSHLKVMHDKCKARMMNFKDFSSKSLASISAPTLIFVGKSDIVTVEHAFEMLKKLTQVELKIVDGGHGDYIGEITQLKEDGPTYHFTARDIDEFLARGR